MKSDWSLRCLIDWLKGDDRMFWLEQFERYIDHTGERVDVNYPFIQVKTDSRKVSSETLFVALPGVSSNGWDYLSLVAEKGCRYAVVPTYVAKGLIASNSTDLNIIGSDDVYALLSSIVKKTIGSFPSHLIGVTGTNGKSSVSYYIAQLADAMGLSGAIIGTFGVGKLNNLESAKQTTPDVLTMLKTLAQFNQDGVDLVAFEASSHALDQDRVAGIEIDTAVFTNLTQDHLDYHGTMESYATAKRKLFRLDTLKHAVFCSKSDYCNFMAEDSKGDKSYYGERPSDDFVIRDVTYHSLGCSFLLLTKSGHYSVELPLMGEFNVDNAVAALASLWPLFDDKVALISSLTSLKGAPGRMERVTLSEGANVPVVLVDYAHTPDALSVALKALAVHSKGPITCVFGCGGDRDKGKRPEMMRAALDLADKVVLTTDNPRSEIPSEIMQDALSGVAECERQRVILDEDRRSAIEFAIATASINEIVLVAGKGHETYQEIGGVKSHFDDREEALNALKKYAQRT